MPRIFLSLLLLGLALGLGYWYGKHALGAPPSVALNSSVQAYVCPMHSHIVQGHPGACPICGMDLVATNATSATVTNQIHVDSATQAKLGVRLANTEHTLLGQDITTYAMLIPDESALLRITANVDGVLGRLYINRIGQRIERGQTLYEISSQEALNLQYEFVDTLRRGIPARKMAEDRREQNRKALEEARDQDAAARELVERNASQSEEQLRSILQPLQRDRDRSVLRLKQMGFTDAMLDRLAKSEQVVSPIAARAERACAVKEILARPGMQVNHMTEILSCVDTTQTWLEISLYPDQLAWIREGDAMTVVFEDGATVKTHLSGLAPIADSTARTLRARLAIKLDRAPTLGEYASVTIHAKPRKVLSVPKSAVMRSGRGNFVMRALDKGHFMPVSVTTGIESAERIAILEGLTEGDQVVVNGQFLLDAAASIADAAQRLKGSSGE